jgi:hypothetical protein
MKKQVIKDKSHPLAIAIFSVVNKAVVKVRFPQLLIKGIENVPKEGPVLVVSNHVSRWDGLLIQSIISHHLHFMVSPNELRGLQGAVLLSCGAIPAHPRLDFIDHMSKLTSQGKSMAMFPEGNLFADGQLHRFKTGAARLAFYCWEQKLPLTLLPIALRYGSKASNQALVEIGEPIDQASYQANFLLDKSIIPGNMAIKTLTTRLEREVSYLRQGLGYSDSGHILNDCGAVKQWVPRVCGQLLTQEANHENQKETYISTEVMAAS